MAKSKGQKKDAANGTKTPAKANVLIDDEYEQKLGAKLATIEELRIELGSEGIECPGVLVVGAQSAGKSSVLERLTGIAFPRAENTCTRVPTIVQLQTDSSVEFPKAIVSKSADFKDECIECSDMTEIQNAILSFTEEMVTEHDPIKDDPIHIRYVRRAGPVMTLIDLPGITHVNTSNQSFDIHHATSSMVRKYVSNKNMIILVVIPANDDFGNSEALQIAQTYDTDGIRTIGVVSKCDLVPEKSDIIQKIRMTRVSDVKLALGFIAVRNKGPGEEDINVKAAEDALFSSHKLLHLLKPEERGYETLSRKIVELQSDQVGQFIPEVKQMVRAKIAELKGQLDGMSRVPVSTGERRSILSRELCDIDARVLRLVRAEDTTLQEHNISARSYELAGRFAAAIRDESLDCLADEMRETLKGLIKEKKGYSLPNFISDAVFRDMITRMFFTGIVDESRNTFVDDVTDLVKGAFECILSDNTGLAPYPHVVTTLRERTDEMLDAARLEAIKLTSAVITAEKRQIFTQNEEYIKFISTTYQALEDERRRKTIEEVQNNFQASHQNEYDSINLMSGLTSKAAECSGSLKSFLQRYLAYLEDDMEERTIMELQVSLHCYSDILMRRLFDVIPMLVFSALIHDVRERYHYHMQENFDDEVLENLLAEDPACKRKRVMLEARYKSMKEALRKLNKLV